MQRVPQLASKKSTGKRATIGIDDGHTIDVYNRSRNQSLPWPISRPIRPHQSSLLLLPSPTKQTRALRIWHSSWCIREILLRRAGWPAWSSSTNTAERSFDSRSWKYRAGKRTKRNHVHVMCQRKLIVLNWLSEPFLWRISDYCRSFAYRTAGFWFRVDKSPCPDVINE